ncbi:MAG TPA: DUF2807 domain-containing protein [Brevundimonas sp.]|nr:DUF2807 domain-containing protein [Brevundimonas sp.]
MIRTLLIIAGAALVLCVATLSGAAAIGGNDLARNGWEWTFRGHGDGGDETIRFRRDDNTPPVNRNLAWTGGERLEIDIPGDITYVQGDTPSVVVTGPKSKVDRVSLVGGRLSWDEDADDVVVGWGRSSRLRVVVTAPSVNSFELNSSADLSIRDYNQPTLTVRVTSSGEVDAAGETQAVTVDLTGSGEVDLSSLRTTDATVAIDGSGDVSVGPTGSARIDISGSGDVDLTRRPANIQQSVSGSGDITQN